MTDDRKIPPKPKDPVEQEAWRLQYFGSDTDFVVGVGVEMLTQEEFEHRKASGYYGSSVDDISDLGDYDHL